MNRLTIAAGVTISAALVGLIAATPAAATDANRWCSTTGATGGIIVYGYDGATTTIVLTINSYDSLADSHHSQVRLLTKNWEGTIKYWPWHANYGGVGTNVSWDTTATESTGIHDDRVSGSEYRRPT